MFVLALGGCRTVRLPAETIRTVKDSITTTVRYHKKDTTITIPGDTSYIRIPITRLSEEPVTQTTGRATASVKKTGDNVEVECRCEEYEELITLFEKHVETLHQKLDSQQDTQIIKDKYVPWHINTLAWVGAISLGIAIGRIGLKFLKS